MFGDKSHWYQIEAAAIFGTTLKISYLLSWLTFSKIFSNPESRQPAARLLRLFAKHGGRESRERGYAVASNFFRLFFK